MSVASSDLLINSIERASLSDDNPEKSESSRLESQLLQRMREGDEDAFLALYRQNHGGIYRFAIRLTGSPSIAEDVLQEVFLALISRPEQFDPAKGNLSNYLFGIAHKQVLRHRNKQKDQILLESPEEQLERLESLEIGDDILEKLSRDQDFMQLHEAISSLPLHYRETIILCDLEEKSYADAAGILNCPIGTIRSRLSRAHLLLMEKMLGGNRGNIAKVNEARGVGP
jgi:RNA polymerase sigma-70 factor, ECF subfamily